MKCRTPFCLGRRTKSGHSPYCAKCRARRFKEKHPLKYFFNKLRSRARERGHEFTLTFLEYEHFATTSGYAALKGKTKYSLSLNRKDPERGYHADNIEAVTLSMNTRLMYSTLPYDLREELKLAMEKSCKGNGADANVPA